MNANALINEALATILAGTPDYMFVKDRSLVYLGASRPFAELTGRADPAEVVGRTDYELFADHSLAQRYRDDDMRMMERGEPLLNYIEPLPPRDGRPRYASTTKLLIRDASGAIIGLCGMSHEITREYEAKLSYERELSYLFNLPPEAVGAAMFDISGWRVVDFRLRSDADHIISRYERIEGFIEEVLRNIVEGAEAQAFFGGFTADTLSAMYARGQRTFAFEYLRRFPDGAKRWVRDEVHFLTDPVNSHLTLLVILRDIDAERRTEKELALAAESDAMTGLLNREGTMRAIGRFLAGEGSGDLHALFMIDVDNFKSVNDTFGHQAGDEVLVDFAGAIRRCFRDTDIVGRIGGDEFFALMRNVPTLPLVRKKARELVEALQYICCTADARAELSGSVGVSLYKGDGKSLDALYAEADAALYQAKRAGKNRFAFASVECLTADAADADHASAIRLRTLMENMDGMMALLELDGGVRVVYVSPSCFTAMQCDAARVGTAGERLLDIVWPEDAPALKAALTRAAMRDERLDHAFRVTHAGGRQVWWHISGSLLPETGEEQRQMLCVITDIDALKRAEAEIREKSRIIELSMADTDINFWVYDLRTNRCTLSENCKRVHGFKADRIEDFPEPILRSGYIREDCQAAVREAYQRLRAEGGSAVVDAWCRGENGWWCEKCTLTALTDDAGRPTRVIGLGKDMTAIKSLESSYRAALDDNPAYIYVVDADTLTITYDNRAIRRRYGRSMVGEKCYASFLGKDAPCDSCPVRDLREGRANAKGREVLRPDGMWLLSQASPLLWNDQTMYMVTCTDISDVKKSGGE